MTAATAKGGRRIKYGVGRYSIPLILILLWELIYLVAGDVAMASPLETIQALLSSVGGWSTHVAATLGALFVSFSICAIFGVGIGFLIGLSAFWTKTLAPLVLILYSIPKVTLYPIFLLVFGLTLQGRIAFAVMHGVLPIIIICIEAARTLPQTYLKLGRAYEMTFWQKARYILVPALMPQLVVALRLGFSLCFLGLLLAEMFASYQGLGSRLLHYTNLQQPEMILAIILIVAFLAFFFTFLFLLWQERVEVRIGKVDVRL